MMQNSLSCTPESSNCPTKAIKHSVTDKSKLYFDSLENRQPIHPIPMMYVKSKQKQYNSKFNRTFAMKGYKYISKIAAVGHLTDDNLKKISQSCLKMTRSVEFDA